MTKITYYPTRRLRLFSCVLLALWVAPRQAHAAREHGAPQATAPVAHVRYIHGGLAMQPGHGSFRPVSVGTAAFDQYGAQTQAKQKASFHFADGTTLHLNERTDVVFHSSSETDLKKGEVAQYLVPGTMHRLVTSSATAAAIGTTFDVRYQSDDSVFVVLEGALQVSNRQGTVVVKTNQQTTVGPGQAPSPPSPVNALAVFDWTTSIPTPDLGRDIGLDANGGVVSGFSSQATSATGAWNASHINDGLLDQGWASADGQTTNQSVKLGFRGSRPYRISGVVIDPAATHGDPANEDLKNFQIRVSSTGTADADFTTVLTGTCRQEAILQRFNLPAPVVAKYVELYALDNYGNPQRVAVAEFEVVATTTSFNVPTGLALDGLGNLYVADTGNNRIQEVSPHGKVLAVWGKKGTGSGQFLSTTGIAVDAHNRIYVADSGNHRIQEFSSPGHFLRSWDLPGAAPARPTSPTSVAVDNHGNVYVGDGATHRIDRLSATGHFITAWRLHHAAGGDCISPSALAADRAGSVYDEYYGASAGSIQYSIHIEKRAPNGKVLFDWNLGASQRCFEAGIAIDGAGNVWVTIPGANAVNEFAPSGRLLARWGGRGSAPGRLERPTGIAVGRQGAILVVDTGNDRIQKVSPQGKPLMQWGG